MSMSLAQIRRELLKTNDPDTWGTWEVRAPEPLGLITDAVEPKRIGVVVGKFGDVLQWVLEHPRRCDFRKAHRYGSIKEYVPPEILEVS